MTKNKSVLSCAIESKFVTKNGYFCLKIAIIDKHIISIFFSNRWHDLKKLILKRAKKLYEGKIVCSRL